MSPSTQIPPARVFETQHDKRTPPSDHTKIPDPRPLGQRDPIEAYRRQSNGQFYAMAYHDRVASEDHCTGIMEELNPQSACERWLASSIAEDMWRLSRARAIENNIYALGMSTDLADATLADRPEVHAAAVQARVWLQDGHKIQALSLYEQRIRRGIEKNQKELKALQAERKAAHDKALEEAKLLAWLDMHEAQIASSTEPDAAPAENSASGQFSNDELACIIRREARLQKAMQLQKQALKHPIRKSA